MTKLADTAARLRALTELESTLLVEAAAGTGKTALMAGRVTMLLAHGAAPGSIAAITFTALAARALEIGRASCRERGGQSVLVSGVAVPLKKTKQHPLQPT